jgi:Nuclease-related domain
VEGFRAARRRRRRAAIVLGILLIAAVGTASIAALVGPGPYRTGTGIFIAVLLSAAAGAGLVMRHQRDPERWLRGAAGEQATAAVLSGLMPRKWVVLHDLAVPGARANIDHLVIGPTGVWLIDSKSSRARVRAGWRSVWLGERRLDPGPTRWEAEVASDRLGVPVSALIVVHGPGLRRRGGRAGGIRVVRPDHLLRRLRRGRRRLTRRDVDDLGRLAAEVLPAAGERRGGRRAARV